MGITIGRLALDNPAQWVERIGEDVGLVGGVPVPAERKGVGATPDIDVWPNTVGNDKALRQRVRRQLRAMLSNLAYRQRGLYVLWTEDQEQSGWYVPGAASLELVGPSGLYVAQWKVNGLELALLGRARTHRRAVRASFTDLRESTSAKDTRGLFFAATDIFTGMTPLAITHLPSTVTDVLAHGFTVPPTKTAAVSGYGGASMQSIVGGVDGVAFSFEQAEVSRNLGDVVIYDRQGEAGALSSTGPHASWEEVYGPDQPLTVTQCPVVENGLCRVSYDSANLDGFRVDVWNGSAWAEQGKITVERYDGTTLRDVDTFVRADVVEWSPERAVIRAVMTATGDASSREEVYVTLQRGWTGPRVEVYFARRPTTGATAGGYVVYTIPSVDTYTSAAVVDASDVGAFLGTGPTASATFSEPTTLGSPGQFTGENWIAMLRQGAAYHPIFAALAATGLTRRLGNNSDAYGSARNRVQFFGQAEGWISMHVGYYPGHADQILEAENMTNGSGSSDGADGNAYNGNEVTTTRTTDANAHVTQATWLNTARGRYRVWARVQTGATQLSVYAKTTATTGATKTYASATYGWVDLGEIVADGSTLEIHLWASSGAGTSALDRVEAFKVEDRTASPPRYDGARDLGAMVLHDARPNHTVIAR